MTLTFLMVLFIAMSILVLEDYELLFLIGILLLLVYYMFYISGDMNV